MKRVAEIDQELQALEEKRQTLSNDRCIAVAKVADVLRQQFPVVYGRYVFWDTD